MMVYDCSFDNLIE